MVKHAKTNLYRIAMKSWEIFNILLVQVKWYSHLVLKQALWRNLTLDIRPLGSQLLGKGLWSILRKVVHRRRQILGSSCHATLSSEQRLQKLQAWIFWWLRLFLAQHSLTEVPNRNAIAWTIARVPIYTKLSSFWPILWRLESHQKREKLGKLTRGRAWYKLLVGKELLWTLAAQFFQRILDSL